MKKWLDFQSENLFLYVPFLMAAGAALYFSLSFEPNLFAPFIISGLLFIIACINKVPKIIRALVLFIFGFCYACAFTNTVNTPQIEHDISNITITGTVKSVDYSDDKTKLYISVPAQDINAGDKSANIRISIKDDITIPKIGNTVKINGGIFQPSPSYAPGTFDYARWSYFNNQSANGYANDLTILDSKETHNINTFRDYLHNKSESFLVDTLILGYKGKVPGEDNQIWNATGVGHIWSISGFHMTLVGGWLFAIFYLIFRTIPYITRRVPAKIPAMIIAWFGLGFYLFLSGTDIATLRAFLMTTLIFAAFILGRNAISMRNVALAFCIIFLINPHCVMQAGFQLSFSAVFGLVWLYSDIKPKMPKNKLLKIIYATVLTSLIASVFTAPFVAAHFSVIPTYSLIGNLILLPIFSVIIMPLVLIGTITAPFGIKLPNLIAHDIYDLTLNIAHTISELPFAQISMPYISNTAMVFFIMALIFLIAVKPIKIKINYVLFILFMSFGIIVVHTEPKPLFYSSYDNELVAFVNDAGYLEFNKSRASNHYFAFDTWKQINNEDTQTKNKRYKHVKGVYKYKTKNFNLVYIQKFVPLMNNIEQLCNDENIDYIVSYFDIDSKNCANKILGYGIMIYPNGKVKNISTKRPWNYNLHQ